MKWRRWPPHSSLPISGRPATPGPDRDYSRARAKPSIASATCLRRRPAGVEDWPATRGPPHARVRSEPYPPEKTSLTLSKKLLFGQPRLSAAQPPNPEFRFRTPVVMKRRAVPCRVASKISPTRQRGSGPGRDGWSPRRPRSGRVESWRGGRVGPALSTHFAAGTAVPRPCPFPAPASSNGACGFPAHRSPANFASRVM